jgi:hypothetical protein
MTPVGFEPTISTGERSYTYALDRATTGTDELQLVNCIPQSQAACGSLRRGRQAWFESIKMSVTHGQAGGQSITRHNELAKLAPITNFTLD